MADERDEPDEQPLDPETIARRRAAMAYVVQWGDPVLKSRALPVERFDDALRDEVARMAGLMEDALGAGLAATQLGVLRRVLVYRVGDEPTRALVNPRITWESEEREVFGEGCLSLPGVWGEIERPSAVRVEAQDERGAPVELEASGPEASVRPARDRPPRRRPDPRPHGQTAAPRGDAPPARRAGRAPVAAPCRAAATSDAARLPAPSTGTARDMSEDPNTTVRGTEQRDDAPPDEPHEPTDETPADIPEGQAEPERPDSPPGAPPTTPLDPPTS